ncbi:hypothetical protein [Streptomyces hainanensis]|uniref:Uncharacterized protein n=1 Tax=Streptomyces hainanensis TaxID=402648 RepID=A0A4R4T7M9_9ACTN|nr:hypothetical protein [Streptomyces hainanensis]TDC73161.1 hypothetical protein E1283_19835 [Streptomyces hainanensis]
MRQLRGVAAGFIAAALGTAGVLAAAPTASADTRTTCFTVLYAEDSGGYLTVECDPTPNQQRVRALAVCETAEGDRYEVTGPWYQLSGSTGARFAVSCEPDDIIGGSVEIR